MWCTIRSQSARIITITLWMSRTYSISCRLDLHIPSVFYATLHSNSMVWFPSPCILESHIRKSDGKSKIRKEKSSDSHKVSTLSLFMWKRVIAHTWKHICPITCDVTNIELTWQLFELTFTLKCVFFCLPLMSLDSTNNGQNKLNWKANDPSTNFLHNAFPALRGAAAYSSYL